MRTEYMLQRQVDQVLDCLTPANRTVAKVMLYTGLRLGDVLALRTEQIKPRTWVTEAKTGKRRMIGLPAQLREEIMEGAGSVYAFPSRYGEDRPEQHRNRTTVWKDIKRAARAYRMPQNIGAHSLRKVYAVDLMAKYGDIERVRKALNHDRYATTVIYAMADAALEQRLKHGKTLHAGQRARRTKK